MTTEIQDTETPQAQQETAQVETPVTKSIADPELSQGEYERLRREGKNSIELSAKETSAPEANASEQETPAASEPVETEAETELDEPIEPGKPQKKGGFQKKIDKLTKRAGAAEQEKEYWKELVLKSAGAPKTEIPKVEAAKATEGKPNIDNFKTHAEWVEAVIDWKSEQKLKERDQRDQQSKVKTEQEKTVQTYRERLNAFRDKTPDFADVDDAAADALRDANIRISPAVESILVTSENGPELGYEIAKNPAELIRICKLPPLAAAQEIGMIKARLSTKAPEAKAETKKITGAPKPIATIGTGGKGSIAKTIYDPDLDQRAYERLRAEESKKRRRA